MGSAESQYVRKQEEFVSKNVEKYKRVLPEYYNTRQIKGKLRELYAGSDLCRENQNTYIFKDDWISAKSKINSSYQTYNSNKSYYPRSSRTY